MDRRKLRSPKEVPEKGCEVWNEKVGPNLEYRLAQDQSQWRTEVIAMAYAPARALGHHHQSALFNKVCILTQRAVKWNLTKNSSNGPLVGGSVKIIRAKQLPTQCKHKVLSDSQGPRVWGQGKTYEGSGDSVNPPTCKSNKMRVLYMHVTCVCALRIPEIPFLNRAVTCSTWCAQVCLIDPWCYRWTGL